MKLIIGLGNPGEKYRNNRHNVGHLVVEKLKTPQYHSVRGKQNSRLKRVIIAKSNTFMNESGSFVAKQIKNLKFKIKNLIVIHDDLDIPLGSYKIQFGKGPKDHNGIKSIDDALETDQYWHVRVGVENRKVLQVGQGAQVSRVPRGEEYVLQNFTDEERVILNDVIKKIVRELTQKLTG